MFARNLIGTLFVALLLSAILPAEEKPAEQATEFSGPQPGEKLTPFTIRTLLGDAAGEELDLVEQADGQPLVLFFIHDANRPSIGLTRVILTFAAKHKADGLHSGLIFLSGDATMTEAFVKRAAHALPDGVPVGVSTDGAEGPGAYGLNRKVTVTVLVAKDNKITANFALVQPSLQADGPKIAQAIASAGAFKAPTLEELERIAQPARRR